MIDLEKSLYEQRHEQRRATAHGPMAKTLPDLVRYKELIRVTRPNMVIETGTWTGASAHWFGHQMIQARVGPCGVITIDPQPTEGMLLTRTYRDGYTIVPLHGSSTDAEGVLQYVVHLATLEGVRPMVVLDSDHAAAHVLQELELYAALVANGCYLVVEDTITRHLAGHGGYVGSPADAVEEWFERHPFAGEHFYRDMELEDMLPTTQNPGGWLRRRD